MRSFIPLFALLAACPGPSKPIPDEPLPSPSAKARFADASEAERAGAVLAALGFGPVYATFAQFQADMDARSVDDDNAPSGCPELDVLGEDPLRVRYEADSCTAPSGAVYEGSLEVTNPVRWEDAASERAGGTALVAKRFSTGEITVDGSWSQTETAPGQDATSYVDLAVTVGDQTLRLAGQMAITWESGATRAVCAEGLHGALDGLGGFDVACDVRDLGGQTSGGFVELDGLDTLRVELAPDADGCFPATVDGETVAPICLGDEIGDGGGEGGGDGGEEAPDLDGNVFGGSGLGCLDDQLLFDAQTDAGAIAGVEIALAKAGASAEAVEVHALATDLDWLDESYDGWRLELVTGAYEAGASTTLSCDGDYETLHGVYFAYDADGEVIGCQLAGFAHDAGPIDLSECPRR